MTHRANQLAICGGLATIEAGPPPWPVADPSVLAAIKDAYDSGNWGRYLGPYTQTLRQRLSEMHDVDHTKLCASGTVAIELALRGLDIGTGDEVILGAYDYPGNFRCIEQVGAHPVLADVDSTHGCLSIDQLDAAHGPSVRAIIVSHLHSGLAPMDSIMEWAKDHGVFVVEDACQSPGSIVDGKLAGSWGDVGVLSFGGSKLLTAGRGGALLIRDPVHAQRVRVFADRGNDAYPLSELQAAVILPQLDQLSERNTKRQAAVQLLRDHFTTSDCLSLVQDVCPENRHSYYKVAWRYNAQQGGWTREELTSALRAEGVAVDAGFRGFTRRSANRCRRATDLNESKRAASSTILLHHPVLLEPDETIKSVAAAFSKVLSGFVPGTS